jgi:ribosomal protein L27
VTNTASFASDNAGTGFDDAIFTIEEGYKYMYLPLTMRNG